MNELERLAELIRQQNRIFGQIAAIVDRPALQGHVGEFIAARIFGITLAQSATQKSIDGHFTSGSLAGRSVNIKWYAKREGILDITPTTLPDFYLVLTGPAAGPVSSRGQIRPWCIEAVFLFEASLLVAALNQFGVRVGIATSVRQDLWRKAEIYPRRGSPALLLSEEQRTMLGLFSVLRGATH